MVIRFPTGWYKSVLPAGPGSGGNVTFIISNTIPPRTELSFPIIPDGVSLRQHPELIIADSTRRQAVDKLMFTVQQTSRSSPGTNMQQYEIGTVLDFGNITKPLTVQPFAAGAATEIRHDTGLIDFDRIGITPDEQALIEQSGQAAYTMQQQQLADVRTQYSNLQVQIQENQKLIVETNKALSALEMLGTTDTAIANIVKELTVRLNTLLDNRKSLIDSANSAAQQADVLLSGIRALAQIIR